MKWLALLPRLKYRTYLPSSTMKDDKDEIVLTSRSNMSWLEGKDWNLALGFGNDLRVKGLGRQINLRYPTCKAVPVR